MSRRRRPSLAAMREELREVEAEIGAAYWRFTRQARALPPSMAVPGAYRRRAELERVIRKAVALARRPSPSQALFLADVGAGLDPWARLHGGAAHGGFEATWVSCVRAGWVVGRPGSWALTDLGRAALP